MDDQKHVTDTSDGPDNTNAANAGGWSLTARLGSLLLSLAFTKHAAAAATRPARARHPAPKPSELCDLHPDQLWTGDAVLWHHEDGSLVPAKVVRTGNKIAGQGSRGQRVQIVREDYVWSSELELDPIRGMSTWREDAIAERIDPRACMSTSARRSVRG